MLLPAPARFSTKNVWPSASASFTLMSRAVRSLGPPAANGTTIRTGRSGYAAAAVEWPNALAPAAPIASAPVARSAARRVGQVLSAMIVSLLSVAVRRRVLSGSQGQRDRHADSHRVFDRQCRLQRSARVLRRRQRAGAAG